MKKLFPSNSLTALCKRENNLNESLSLSLFPPKFDKNKISINSCNKCNICSSYLICDNKFNCKVTGRVYTVRGSLSCNSPKLVYVISCKNCGDQYVGSATDFKASLKIHKSTGAPCGKGWVVGCERYPHLPTGAIF